MNTDPAAAFPTICNFGRARHCSWLVIRAQERRKEKEVSDRIAVIAGVFVTGFICLFYVRLAAVRTLFQYSCSLGS